MTPSELNRRYAVVFYVLYSLIVGLAMGECIQFKAYFHIPIFAFFILAYMAGAYAALAYRLSVERRVLLVCITVGGICSCVNFMLLSRLDAAIVIRSIAVIVCNTVWFVYRLRCVLWLRKEALQIISMDRRTTPR